MHFLSLALALVPTLLLASFASASTSFGHIARSSQPVDVTLFVMSRCPDAIKCEQTFAEVFRTENLPEVNPSLSFIGKLTENKDGTTTVTCLHGPQECAGNVQQLCFKKYHADYHVWFAFVNALNTVDPKRIGHINYAREVAGKLGYEGNFHAVEQCAQSDEGHQLHVASVQHTLNQGVSTSCTVYINHQKRCVVDGGVWRDCPDGSRVEDFVRSIREAAHHYITKIRLSLYQIWN